MIQESRLVDDYMDFEHDLEFLSEEDESPYPYIDPDEYYYYDGDYTDDEWFESFESEAEYLRQAV